MSEIQIDAVRLSGGDTHEHITHLHTTLGVQYTRAQLVAAIEQGLSAVSWPGKRGDEIGVYTSSRDNKYVRTYGNGYWNDNLLALPRF